MAAEIIWSPEARQDLLEIASFVASDSPAHALALTQKIEKAVEDLAPFPFVGHPLPGRKLAHLRHITVFNYCIIYRPGVERISVVAVIHGARRLLKALYGRPTD
ncbi:MAG: type II toxin-antitoxin system RelE/ParE family toxin [Planctomycetota bacterium]